MAKWPPPPPAPVTITTVVQVNRRILTLVAALIPVLVLGVVGSVLTVPFVALGPGPTFNTLGEVDGKEVVDVEGAQEDPTTGHLNMTTVSVRDGLSIFEAFGFWASGKHGLVPRAEVYPPGVSRDEIDKSNQQDFKDSEGNAEVAALHYLNLPTVVLLRKVSDDGPAKGCCAPATSWSASTARPCPSQRTSSPRCRRRRPVAR